MIPLLIVLVVLLVVALIFGGFIAGIYNKLVTLRNRYKNAYAQIDVQLKRRYDLIPNLACLVTDAGPLSAKVRTMSTTLLSRGESVKSL